MYTGLIQEIGTITTINKRETSLLLVVQCNKVINGLRIGDSVGINGVCQTVIEFTQNSLTVFVSSETLSITTFNKLKVGTKVNLERTMKLSDRLDGHLVSGHVDGIGTIKKIDKNGDTRLFTIETSTQLMNQIVTKGSITIDGISLTVSKVDGDSFCIAVIPHTFNNTNLKYLSVGDNINIETDMIAKYVEKYLLSQHNSNGSKITADFLERNGFI